MTDNRVQTMEIEEHTSSKYIPIVIKTDLNGAIEIPYTRM